MALATSLVVLLSGLGWISYYRYTFHTFVWWEPPPRIDYCGRYFDQGATLAAMPTDYAYRQVMTIEPSGWPVYASQPRAGFSAPLQEPCTMGLVLKESDHQYVQYGLVGGP